MAKPITAIEGFIIQANKYQEKDALITVLTEKGKANVRVRGGFDPAGKLHEGVLVFNRVLLDCSVGENGYLAANGVKTVKNYTFLYEDLEKSLAGQYACELLLKYFQDDDQMPFKAYENYFAGLEQGFDILTLAFLFTCQVIKCLGYGPDINACVDCGRNKNLVAFSLTEGGFICQECARELNLAPDSTTYLKVMRYGFMVEENNILHAVLPPKETARALNECVIYLQDQLGLEPKTYKMLLGGLKIV